MELSEALDELNKKLFYFDWYAKKVEKNAILHNSIVAYVHRMGLDVYSSVPDKIGNWDVRIHYIGSHTANAEAFKTTSNKTTLEKLAEEVGELPVSMLAASSLPEVGITETDVANELWQLSKLCGWETVEDIFFEIHDGKNAVTNKSKDFPKVREKLAELYELVGFDVLADEIC